MIATRTFEERHLSAVEMLVDACTEEFGDAYEARFQLLEATASRLGGFDLGGYQEAFGVRPLVESGRLIDMAAIVIDRIVASGIPPALALSALARERLGTSRQKAAGAYHTDHRLATRLASNLREALVPGAQVIDPACGAGMLLTAVSIAACGRDRGLAAEWMAESIHAADMSEAALRGTLVALSSLTNNLEALRKMRSRWLLHDSLTAPPASWRELSPGGFDVVIGNPPWEKVKLSRHEFVRGQGGDRHYGQTFETSDLRGYEDHRRLASDRSLDLAGRYQTLGEGEPDLYVAFTELMVGLTRPGGAGALLVPGGMIRSKGTEPLRRYLLGRSAELKISILDNKARFFGIDTRFKFLAVVYRTGRGPKSNRPPVELSHSRWSSGGFEQHEVVTIPRNVLEQIRPDLTVPEVRDNSEWRIFLKAQRGGIDVADPDNPWFARFCREVDMTHARSQFLSMPGKGAMGVVEGRMIQPHRFGAKIYLGGQGRAARWAMMPPGTSMLRPQFWIDGRSLPATVRDRCSRLRAGFCDITGQTNERTMMAALIPPGVVCGNKVPTVLFPNDPGEDRLHLWVAIVNSLPFDWLMRRVVTTTVNYFVLLSLRLPPLQPDSLPGRRLVEIGRRLRDLDRTASTFENLWRIGRLRAEADVLVARAYGLDGDELLKMTQDFPLLDRGQPILPDDLGSTVTRDLIMATWYGERREGGSPWAARVQAYYDRRAVPYVPSEIAGNNLEIRNVR